MADRYQPDAGTRERIIARLTAAAELELGGDGVVEEDVVSEIGHALRSELEVIARAVAEDRLLTNAELGMVAAMGSGVELARAATLIRIHRLVVRALVTELEGRARSEPATPAAWRALRWRARQLEGQVVREIAAQHVQEAIGPEANEGPPQGLAPAHEEETETTGSVRTPFVPGTVHVVAMLIAPDLPIVDRDVVLRSIVEKATPALETGPFRVARERTGAGFCIVVPQTTQAASSASVAAVVSDTIAALRADQPRAALCGIGRPLPGINGFNRSFTQARRAVDIAGHSPLLPPVLTYDDAIPYALLLDEPELAQDLLVILSGIRAQEQGDVLLQTLVAFMDCSGVAETAERLGVHRHTVSARLERIQETTGRSFEAPADLLLLRLAVWAMRLLRPHLLGPLA